LNHFAYVVNNQFHNRFMKLIIKSEKFCQMEIKTLYH
jgi:hypothetical protein